MLMKSQTTLMEPRRRPNKKAFLEYAQEGLEKHSFQSQNMELQSPQRGTQRPPFSYKAIRPNDLREDKPLNLTLPQRV